MKRITQARYIHAQLSRDTTLPKDNDSVAQYLALVAGVQEYRDAITRDYLSHHPAEAMTYPTALDIQNDRAALWRRLMSESPVQKLLQSLKLRGLALGTAELQNAKSDLDDRLDRFAKEEFPHMQAQAPERLARLAGLYARENRWDAALQSQRLALAFATARNEDKLEQQRALDSTVAQAEEWLLRDGREAALERRIGIMKHLEGIYQPRGGIPAELRAMRDSDYRVYAAELYHSGLKENARARREALLEAANIFVKHVGADELSESIVHELHAEAGAPR